MTNQAPAPILELREVSKRYGGAIALDGVDFEAVRPGGGADLLAPVLPVGRVVRAEEQAILKRLGGVSELSVLGDTQGKTVALIQWDDRAVVPAVERRIAMTGVNVTERSAGQIEDADPEGDELPFGFARVDEAVGGGDGAGAGGG